MRNMNSQQTSIEDYVSRYGGACRDCADFGPVCPNSGLPCNSDKRRQAINHVLSACRYGFKHGYLKLEDIMECHLMSDCTCENGWLHNCHNDFCEDVYSAEFCENRKRCKKCAHKKGKHDD